MVPSSTRHLLLALLVAGTLGLAACGGGGGSGTTPNPGPQSSSTPSVSGSCQPPPAPGNGTAYALGATRTWCLSVATIGTSNVTYENVATTLMAQGAHLNVWVDNADTGTSTSWDQFATDFDQIYAKDTQYFGGRTFPWLGSTQSPYSFSECDANGNALQSGQYVNQPNFSDGNNNGFGAQIDMVITDKLGSGEGGYFNAIDLVSNASARCSAAYSNEAQVFFAEAPGGMSPTFYQNGDVLRTEAHEFQHMLHAINKTYTIFAKNGPPEISDPSWIDEGFSMLAEDLAYPSSPGPSGDPIRYAYQYAIAPSNYSLTAFEGLACAPTATSTPCPTSIYNYTAGNYGAAYLFWRWAVDTYGTGILAKVIQSSDTGPNGTGINEVQTALNGIAFPQLFQQFSLAFAGSIAAYNVTAPQPYTLQPSPTFDDSYGTYTIPSPCQGATSDSHVICNANNTATFHFYGPQPPSPGYSLLAGGAQQQLALYVGTANYIPISGATGPNSMTADDASSPDGLLVGDASMTAPNAGAAAACSGGTSTKASCIVNTTPYPSVQPPAETFIVDLANPVANSSTLAQSTLGLTDAAGTVPPPEARLPAATVQRGLPAQTPALMGDGFLRTDRPAAVGQQALSRLFARGVIRRTLSQGPRRR